MFRRRKWMAERTTTEQTFLGMADFNGDTNTLLEEESMLSESEKQKEPLNPKGSPLGAVGNLSNTILGAGMLGLPFAVRSSGLVLGGLFLVFAVWAAIFGLHLLNNAASKVPHKEGENRKSSYFAVASVTFPKAAIIIDCAVAIKCFGVAISYLIVSGQLMTAACKQFQVQKEWEDS